MKISIVVPVAALLVSAAFGCRDRGAGNNATDPTTTTASPNTAMAGGLSDGDRDFMTKAAQGGTLEVALGQDVAQRAVSPEVKAFGQRMVTDHGKANDELKALAAKKGVALPSQLDDDHAKKVREMSKRSGADLDKAYTADMVDDHEKDVKEFREAAKDAKDPELRAWAAKTLPVLESHLQHVKGLEKK